MRMSRETVVQVAGLIYAHSVIGWGFTLLQNWIPTILAGLGMRDLSNVGLLSALPWVVSALASTNPSYWRPRADLHN